MKRMVCFLCEEGIRERKDLAGEFHGLLICKRCFKSIGYNHLKRALDKAVVKDVEKLTKR